MNCYLLLLNQPFAEETKVSYVFKFLSDVNGMISGDSQTEGGRAR